MLVNIAFLNMLTLANHAGQHGWPTVNVGQRVDMLLNSQHAYFGRPCWSTWLTNIECWSTLLLLFANIVKSTACQHGSMSVMMLVNMVGQHWPMSANIVPTTTPNVVQHSSLPMINVGQHQCRCTCPAFARAAIMAATCSIRTTIVSPAISLHKARQNAFVAVTNGL